MRRLALVFVLPAAVAAAEPAPGNAVIVGGALFDTDRFLHTALTLDGGLRLGRSPLWLHASGAWGATLALFDGHGPFARGMLGVESEVPCRTESDHPERWSCLLLGLDVGYETSTVHYRDPIDTPDTHDHGLVAEGRLGVQGTWHHLAVRGDLHGLVHREQGAPWAWGAGVAIAVGYRR